MDIEQGELFEGSPEYDDFYIVILKYLLLCCCFTFVIFLFFLSRGLGFLS